MFSHKIGYVVQFEDKTFLRDGFFNGFVFQEEGNSNHYKTKNVDEAKQFSFKWQVDKWLFHVGIKESYTIRQVRNQIILLPEGMEDHTEGLIGNLGYIVYTKEVVVPEEFKPFIKEIKDFALYIPVEQENQDNFLELVKCLGSNYVINIVKTDNRWGVLRTPIEEVHG